MARSIPGGVILLSGTNGTTTTARLVRAVLDASGTKVAANTAGANLERGVATALLNADGAEVALFEVDEAALPALTAQTRPRAVTLMNLFRDQLDRYGELEHLAHRWREAVSALDPSAVLIYNADDPVVTVARAVIPSVVLIEVNPSRTGQEIPIPPDLDEGVPDSGTEPPGERPRYGQGSGIIYDASGLILTNAHVLGDADAVRVQFADGTRAEGVVVGAAPAIDVGLVRVDTDMALRPAVFADRSTVEVGQLAVAVGSPFGLQQSVTSGIVSAVGRAIREGTGDGAFVEMIQTDAPINPGNSGGALANRFGQVIGMNTLIQTDGQVSGNIGLGFAIPSDIALNIVQRILNGESTDLGYLGVWGTDPEIGEPGALIIEVEPDTPAGEAGLQEGDLIVNIDGEAVSTFTELAAKVQFRVPGTEARLEVVREGAPLEITVVIGSRPVSQQTDGQGEE